jgi:hypothetical protein
MWCPIFIWNNKKGQEHDHQSAVSHIPQFGDATTSPAGDAASPTGDVDVSAGDAYLRKEMPREMRYLLREICSHLQISGYVTLLIDFTKNKKKFLCSTESKYRNQTTSTPCNYIMNKTSKTIFTLFTWFVYMNTIGCFLDFIKINYEKYRNERFLTVISTSGRRFGTSAAIKCRSSCREKSPVYKI